MLNLLIRGLCFSSFPVRFLSDWSNLSYGDRSYFRPVQVRSVKISFRSIPVQFRFNSSSIPVQFRFFSSLKSIHFISLCFLISISSLTHNLVRIRGFQTHFSKIYAVNNTAEVIPFLYFLEDKFPYTAILLSL